MAKKDILQRAKEIRAQRAQDNLQGVEVTAENDVLARAKQIRAARRGEETYTPTPVEDTVKADEARREHNERQATLDKMDTQRTISGIINRGLGREAEETHSMLNSLGRSIGVRDDIDYEMMAKRQQPLLDYLTTGETEHSWRMPLYNEIGTENLADIDKPIVDEQYIPRGEELIKLVGKNSGATDRTRNYGMDDHLRAGYMLHPERVEATNVLVPWSDAHPAPVEPIMRPSKDGLYHIGDETYTEDEMQNALTALIPVAQHGRRMDLNPHYRDAFAYELYGKNFNDAYYGEMDKLLAELDRLEANIAEQTRAKSQQYVETYGRPVSARATANFVSQSGANSSADNVLYIERAKDYVNSLKDNSFKAGLKEGFDLYDFATAGVSGLFQEGQLKRILDKANSGKRLTDEERTMYEVWGIMQEADALQRTFYRPEPSFWNKVGRGVGESAEMLPSFALGMGSVEAIGAKSIGLAGLKQIARKQGMKGLAKHTFNRAGVYGLRAGAATPASPMMWSNYMKRRNDQYSIVDGNLVKRETSALGDLGIAYVETFNEYYSEMLGGGAAKLIDISPSMFGRLINIDKWGGKMGLGKVMDYVNSVIPSDKVRNTMINMGFSGPLTEAPSEAIGDLMTNAMLAPFSDEYGFEHFKDPDYYKELLMTTTIFGGGMGVFSVGSQINNVREVNKAIKKRDYVMSKISDEGLANSLKGVMALDSIDEMSNALVGLHLETLPADQAAAAIEYIANATQVKVGTAEMMEETRMSQFADVVKRFEGFTYQGKDGTMPSDRIVAVKDKKSGEVYYVTRGDFDANSDVHMLKVKNAQGEDMSVISSAVEYLDETTLDTRLIDVYENMFGADIAAERIAEVEGAVRSMENPTREDIRAHYMRNGFQVYNNGSEVTLVDGRKSIVEGMLDNGHYLVRSVNPATQMEELFDIPFMQVLQTNDAVAKGQQKYFNDNVNEVAEDITKEEAATEATENTAETPAEATTEESTVEEQVAEDMPKELPMREDGSVDLDAITDVKTFAEQFTLASGGVQQAIESVKAMAARAHKSAEELREKSKTLINANEVVDANKKAAALEERANFYDSVVAEMDTEVVETPAAEAVETTPIEFKEGDLVEHNGRGARILEVENGEAILDYSMQDGIVNRDKMEIGKAPVSELKPLAEDATAEDVTEEAVEDAVEEEIEKADNGVVDNIYAKLLPKKMRNVLDTMAKNLGVKVVFVEEVITAAGAHANADVRGNVVRIAWGDRGKSIDFLAGHEFLHRMKDMGPEAYEEFKQSVIDYLGEAEWNRRIGKMKAVYESHNKRAALKGKPLLSYSEALLEEEVVADVAGELVGSHHAFDIYVNKQQGNISLLDKVRKVLRAISDYIRRLGARTEAQRVNEMVGKLNTLIDRAMAEAKKKGVNLSNEQMFSLESQPIFYSNAEYAVRGIKQEKATPEQWLKMIEKNGGLKAGEDKWLGLSDWLKASDKKTLTKDEVLQYIAENDIQIEEVEYSEANAELLDRVGELTNDLYYIDESINSLNESIAKGKQRLKTLTDAKRVFDEKAEALKQEYGEDSPEYQNHIFYDSYTDDIESLEASIAQDEEYYNTQSERADALRSELEMLNEEVGDEREINSTRLDYTTKGLGNKREIALVVPTIEPWNASDNIHFGDAGEGRAVAWIRFGETTDASGKRVLVIDEIQSKRHQEGREKGYRDVEAEKREKAERERELTEVVLPRLAELNQLYNEKYGVGKWRDTEYDRQWRPRRVYRFLTPEEQAEHESLSIRATELQTTMPRRDGIPSAPFEKNWVDLAMKRMLRYAAENDFDKVAWTTGDQQAERYNIGNVVTRILSYDGQVDGNEVKHIELHLTDRSRKRMAVDANGVVVSSEGDFVKAGTPFADVVGKEVARKVLDGEGEDATLVLRDSKDGVADAMMQMMQKYGVSRPVDLNAVISAEDKAVLDAYNTQREVTAKEIDGDGLRIGGEGMKAFYDQMLPSFVRKYAKKWGATVGEVTMPDLEENNTMHSVDVTDAMRESVMQGQPKFSLREVNTRFNEELATLTEENARERILNVGTPSPILLACGIEDKPIRLYGAKLLSKVRKHGYKIDDLKNLPLAISSPIAVFEGSKKNSFAILTELRIGNNNVLAALSVGKGGHDVDFNIISSVYDKREDSVARWVNDGKMLWVDKKKALDYFSVSAPLAEAQNNQELISTTKVIQNFQNPKIEPKFSLRGSDKSLVGLHNISLDKLRKAIKMGGLANPSVAVIDVDKATHEDYGDYTLVLTSNMVDARLGRNAGTWAGDAWTPTYPQVVKRIAMSKDITRFHMDIDKMPEAMRNRVRLQFGSFLEDRPADSFAYWYLFEKGVAPEMAVIPPVFPDDIVKMVSEATDGTFYMWQKSDEQKAKCVDAYIAYKYDGDRAVYEADLQSRKERLQRALNTTKSQLVAKKAAGDLAALEEFGFDYDAVSTFLREVETDNSRRGQSDVQGTIRLAEDYIKDNNLEEDYQSWRDSLEGRYGIKEYIFDGYTESRNQRWLPHTTANASKWMKKQGREGATGTFPSFGLFVATVIPRMTTLNTIRKRKGHLGRPGQEYEAFKEKWENVYFELGQKLQPDAERFEDYGWWRLIEAVSTNNPKEHIKKQYGIELSADDMQKLNDMLDAIKSNYPARYFETKFERPVELSEFIAAVVPNDIPADVEASLQDAYLNIYKYDKGVEGSRQEAVLEATDSPSVRFSLMEKPENEARYHLSNPYGGNSGYIGYSMSKRAAEAREEGRYPKTDFKKTYDMPQATLDALVNAGVINDKEWHHTSVYGNKTTFYGWGTYGESPYMSEYYKAHKAEIDEVAKNHGDLTPYLDGFEEFEADVDANDTYVAQLKAQAEAEREAQRREEERLFQERIDEERREREDSERKRAYVEANLPAEFVASNGVTIKPKGYSEYPAYRDGEAITSASSSNKRKAASKARAEFKEQIIAPLEEAYASQNEAKLSLRDIANDVREYDATNGTELYDWLSFVESGSIAKNKTQFHIANTGEILNEYGIKGKINVTRKAINTKRHTDNDDHKLGVSGWAFLVATINSPLVITRYNNEPNSYRIYTIAEINGKNICAGVDVNATNGVEITKITTAFGRDITKIEASSKEKEIYRNENAAEQISGSDNSHLYARLLSTTKVIQNFENPKIEPKFSLRELDAPYLEAVERGDMETAQRMVLEAAKRAMPDTKVVDESGNPKVVYHATPGDTFYKFDISHFGATDGGSLGKGFYFAETKRMTEAYGPNVHSYFLNLSNPINAKLNEIEAFVLGSKTKEDLYERLKLQESFSSQEEMEAMYAIIDSIPQEMIDEVNSTYDGSYYPADELSEYMAVEPNQIKSADPVTYDDAGNVIPLSERFNPKKEDIRYSLSEEDARFERMTTFLTDIAREYNVPLPVFIAQTKDEFKRMVDELGVPEDEVDEENIRGNYFEDEQSILMNCGLMRTRGDVHKTLLHEYGHHINKIFLSDRIQQVANKLGAESIEAARKEIYKERYKDAEAVDVINELVCFMVGYLEIAKTKPTFEGEIPTQQHADAWRADIESSKVSEQTKAVLYEILPLVKENLDYQKEQYGAEKEHTIVIPRREYDGSNVGRDKKRSTLWGDKKYRPKETQLRNAKVDRRGESADAQEVDYRYSLEEIIDTPSDDEYKTQMLALAQQMERDAESRGLDVAQEIADTTGWVHLDDGTWKYYGDVDITEDAAERTAVRRWLESKAAVKKSRTRKMYDDLIKEQKKAVSEMEAESKDRHNNSNYGKAVDAILQGQAQESLPIEDQILVDIALGQKLRWEDEKDGKRRGLKSELGLRSAKAEGMRGVTGGNTYVEDYVAAVMERNNGYENDIDDNDVRNAVIEVFGSYPSRKAALEELSRRYPDAAINEATEALDRLEFERNEALAQIDADLREELADAKANPDKYERAYEEESSWNAQFDIYTGALQKARNEVARMERNLSNARLSQREKSAAMRAMKKAVTEMLRGDLGRYTRKRDIQALMNAVNEAQTTYSMMRAIDKAMMTINELRLRKEEARMRNLLKMRIVLNETNLDPHTFLNNMVRSGQMTPAVARRVLDNYWRGINASGIPVAKGIDGDTAKVMDFISYWSNLDTFLAETGVGEEGIDAAIETIWRELNGEAVEKPIITRYDNVTAEKVTDTQRKFQGWSKASPEQRGEMAKAVGLIHGYLHVQQAMRNMNRESGTLAIEEDISKERKAIKELHKKIEKLKGEKIVVDDETIKDAEKQIREHEKAIDSLLRARLNARMKSAGKYNAGMPMVVEQLYQLNSAVEDLLHSGKINLQHFRGAQQEHQRELINMALEDIDKPQDETKHKHDYTAMQKIQAAWPVRYFRKHLPSMEHMLRRMGRNSVDGEGKVFNYFLTNLMRAYNRIFEETAKCNEMLTAKTEALFGEGMTYKRVMRKAERKVIGTVTERNGNDVAVQEYTIANALYTIAMWEQPIGRATLVKQGITEGVIKDLRARLKKDNPAWLEFERWVVDDFLPSRRVKYNAVYREMNGTDMGHEVNYFPIRRREPKKYQSVDLASPSFENKPSTMTGALIERIDTVMPIDIESSFFGVLNDNITEMERWSEMAPVTRDFNLMLSSPRVKAAMDAIDEHFYEDFLEAAKVATLNYTGDQKKEDDILMQVALRMWGASKLAWKMYTALKQVTSGVLALPYSADPKFFGRLVWYASGGKGMVSDAVLEKIGRGDLAVKEQGEPLLNIQWAIKNSPMFKRRWQSGVAGNDIFTRELKYEDHTRGKRAIRDISQGLDWFAQLGMKPIAFVDACTVATIMRTVYDYEREALLADGYSEEEANEKAMFRAELFANKTQQSSETEYLSPLQMERGVTSMITIFQNAPFAQGRMMADAWNELTRDIDAEIATATTQEYINLREHKYAEDIKAVEDTIAKEKKAGVITNNEEETMRRDQLMRPLNEKIKEEAATRAAKRISNAKFKAVRTFIYNGWLGQAVFNISGYLPYLIFGDDDEKKKIMLKDWAKMSMLGPIGTVPLGSALLSAINGHQLSLLGAYAELEESVNDIAKYIREGEWAEVLFTVGDFLFNKLAGVDYKTWLNAWAGIENMFEEGMSAEAMLRAMNAPESQMRLLIGDRKEGETYEEYTTRIMCMYTTIFSDAKYGDYFDDKRKRKKGVDAPFGMSEKQMNEMPKTYDKAYRANVVSTKGGAQEWANTVAVDKAYTEAVETLGWKANTKPKVKGQRAYDIKKKKYYLVDAPIEGMRVEEYNTLVSLGNAVAIAARNAEKYLGQDDETYLEYVRAEVEAKREFMAEYNKIIDK